jgi:pancreatic triacylglycerol lipase
LSYPFNAGIKSVWKKELPLDLNQTLSATDEDLKKSNNTVCYQDLGCITRFSFADPILWPINLLPESRAKINTHFTLYTREQPYNAVRKKMIS